MSKSAKMALISLFVIEIESLQIIAYVVPCVFPKNSREVKVLLVVVSNESLDGLVQLKKRTASKTKRYSFIKKYWRKVISFFLIALPEIKN